MTDVESGFLIGATIHDVAQVVGAGYSISDDAGVIATFVKMLRVALLPVVMIVAMLILSGAQSQKVTVPWFLVMFLILAVLANSGNGAAGIIDIANGVSRWCLVIANFCFGRQNQLGGVS